jgi:ornithine cyclodeaminase/alanine dehydrogenase-like protein (mu-crystallin family)
LHQCQFCELSGKTVDHMAALSNEAITSFHTVLVYGRTQQKIQQCCAEMYQVNGWMITAVSNPNVLLQQCNVIITTTSSKDSLLTTYDPITSITKL